MAGFANKIKKLTGAFSKKGTLNEATSPFGTVAPPFGNNPFDMGGVSGMSAGGPPGIGSVPNMAAGGPPDIGSVPNMAARSPPGMENDPSAQQASASVDNKMVEENSKKIINLESRLSKVDVNISMVQRESVEVKKQLRRSTRACLNFYLFMKLYLIR